MSTETPFERDVRLAYEAEMEAAKAYHCAKHVKHMTWCTWCDATVRQMQTLIMRPEQRLALAGVKGGEK